MNDNFAHEDVTREFDGKKITIRSGYSYASARLDLPNAPVLFTASEALGWEIFSVSVMPDGWCALRCHSGKYLSVRRDCHGKMYRPPIDSFGRRFPANSPEWEQCTAALVFATADTPAAWEMFRIYRHNGGYALRAQFNQEFLCRWDSDSKYGSDEMAAFALQPVPFEIRTVL